MAITPKEGLLEHEERLPQLTALNSAQDESAVEPGARGNGGKAPRSVKSRRHCEHGRPRTICKICGGGSICEHGRERYTCKDCKGNGICPHSRRRYRCKFCKHAGHQSPTTSPSQPPSPSPSQQLSRSSSQLVVSLTAQQQSCAAGQPLSSSGPHPHGQLMPQAFIHSGTQLSAQPINSSAPQLPAGAAPALSPLACQPLVHVSRMTLTPPPSQPSQTLSTSAPHSFSIASYHTLSALGADGLSESGPKGPVGLGAEVVQSSTASQPLSNLAPQRLNSQMLSGQWAMGVPVPSLSYCPNEQKGVVGAQRPVPHGNPAPELVLTTSQPLNPSASQSLSLLGLLAKTKLQAPATQHSALSTQHSAISAQQAAASNPPPALSPHHSALLASLSAPQLLASQPLNPQLLHTVSLPRQNLSPPASHHSAPGFLPENFDHQS